MIVEPVIIWGAILGSGVFGLGLVSALNSKRTAQRKRKRMFVTTEQTQTPADTSGAVSKAMSMAAGGIKNGEENLASVGGHPS